VDTKLLFHHIEVHKQPREVVEARREEEDERGRKRRMDEEGRGRKGEEVICQEGERGRRSFVRSTIQSR